jgi:hypothetical protein
MCFNVISVVCLVVVLCQIDQIVAATVSNNTFAKICRGENGHLSLSPKNNVIQSITEENGHTKAITQTVFVQYNREFIFQCVYGKGSKGNNDGFVPRIDFKPGKTFTQLKSLQKKLM